MLGAAIRLGVELIDAGVRALEAARARRRARDRAYDTRRPHLWSRIDGETWCAYCKVELTASNEHAFCPATGDPPK